MKVLAEMNTYVINKEFCMDHRTSSILAVVVVATMLLVSVLLGCIAYAITDELVLGLVVGLGILSIAMLLPQILKSLYREIKSMLE